MLAQVAAWLGLAYLIWVLGGAMLRELSIITEAPNPDPPGGLGLTAVVGAAVALLSLASGRPRWPSYGLAGLAGLWIGAIAVREWVVTGSVNQDFLLVVITVVGLVLGAGTANPAWAGWSIAALGCAYVYTNLFVLWRNFESLGEDFPRTARGVPPVDELGLSVGGVLDSVLGHFSYSFVGLAGNSNATGNSALVLAAFLAPFALSPGNRGFAKRPLRTGAARIAILAAGVAPAALLLLLLDARAALAGLIFSWIVLGLPHRLLRVRGLAPVSALIAPLIVVFPVALAMAGRLSASGRDCVWESWKVQIQSDPVWGYGYPGSYPGLTCNFPLWGHAHNELLHAWGISGLLGLGAAVGVFSWLAYLAVRFHDRDRRTLMVVLTAATILMGFELVTAFPKSLDSDWVTVGSAAFVVVAARSTGMMHRPTASDRGVRDVALPRRAEASRVQPHPVGTGPARLETSMRIRTLAQCGSGNSIAVEGSGTPRRWDDGRTAAERHTQVRRPNTSNPQEAADPAGPR